MRSSLPLDTYPQWRYPRLRGYKIGDDGEITSHMCVGLPCCGLDLIIEHPASMTALELYKIAGMLDAMREEVRKFPSFSVCKHGSAD